MKTKKFKRVLTLVLALAMLFSLSMVAFAYDGQVQVIVRTSGYDLTTHQYSYTTIDTLTNVGINASDTVKDMINREYSSNWSGSYLHGMTVGNTTYSTIRYTPVPGSFDTWDEYVGGDPIIDSLNQLYEFDAHDDIWLSCESMFGSSWAGYFIMGDETYMCSITHDWIYEVDFAADGYGNFIKPLNNQGKLATMDECELSNGDIVRLTYGLVYEVFFPENPPMN